MKDSKSKGFGTEPLGKLLLQQAVPASIGILVMSIYGIVDTIFVGRWVGSMGIAAITVVMPIQFLISSIGMAIGIGGASIISRAFGEDNKERADHTFANQITFVIIFSILFFLLGTFFKEDILHLFGASGNVLQPAIDYFSIILIGLPSLTWAMMTNTVIRSEGYPKVSMFTLIIPAFINLALDPIFILYFDMGIKGAAWATSISFIVCSVYTSTFFFTKYASLRVRLKNLVLKASLVKEISSIGSVTLSRQGAISVLAIVLNNSLVFYGGEIMLSVFGVIGRVLMFANFPVLGITQGFVPIAGFNYGAKLFQRLKEFIILSVKSITFLSIGILAVLIILARPIITLFTQDVELINQTVPAMRIVFIATPLIGINLLVSAYYQAIGKVVPALLLTLCKQLFFLVPLALVLPLFFGIDGVWYAFFFADILTAVVSYYYYKKALRSINGLIE
ncbi:MAG: MATE family efflux transporter [Cyclobacteriaceae bacterium]